MAVTRSRRPTARVRAREQLLGKLFPAVEELLADRPFQEIGLDEMLAQAGVPKSTFYYHFDHRNELLIALAQQVIAELADAAWWHAVPRSRRALEQQLTETVAANAPHWLLIGALADVATGDPEVRAMFEGVVDTAVDGLAAHITAGQETGYARRDISAEPVARWIMLMAERGTARLLSEADDASRTEMVRALADIIWAALYEGAPGRRRGAN